MKRPVLSVTCLVISLSVVGCGGGSGGGRPSAAGQASAGSSPTVTPALPGRIAFRRFLNADETRAALFTSAPDGSAERQLTASSGVVVDDEPDWSPDGKLVVFTRTTDSGTPVEQQRLFVVSADGTGLRAVSPARPTGPGALAAGDNSGEFSPDGKHIACGSFHGKVVDDEIQFSGITVMDVDGSHRHQITTSAPYSGDDGGVAWSPDGRQLVYAHSNAGASLPAGGRALFIVDLDGGHRRQLTPWGLGAGGTPDWSATTNRIAFRAVNDEEAGKGNFFTISPDGSGLTQVTHLTDTVISHKVSFAPDGKHLVFAKETDTSKNDIFIVDTDGSDVRRVTNTPAPDSAADWGPPT